MNQSVAAVSLSPTYQIEVRWPLTLEAVVSWGGNRAAAWTLLLEHIPTIKHPSVQSRCDKNTKPLTGKKENTFKHTFIAAWGASVLPPDEDRWTSGPCRCCLGTGRTQTCTVQKTQKMKISTQACPRISLSLFLQSWFLSLSWSPDLITCGCDHQSIWHQNGGFGLLDLSDRHHGNGDLARNNIIRWEAVFTFHNRARCSPLRWRRKHGCTGTLVSLPNTLEWKQIQWLETNIRPW